MVALSAPRLNHVNHTSCTSHAGYLPRFSRGSHITRLDHLGHVSCCPSGLSRGFFFYMLMGESVGGKTLGDLLGPAGSAPALSVANRITILLRRFNCMHFRGRLPLTLLRIACGRGNSVTHTRRV